MSVGLLHHLVAVNAHYIRVRDKILNFVSKTCKCVSNTIHKHNFRLFIHFTERQLCGDKSIISESVCKYIVVAPLRLSREENPTQANLNKPRE